MSELLRFPFMSAHSINLRSENPALLVEFRLPPGSHARIGAAMNAEISLPLAGLAEYVCMIGRCAEGRIYLADPDGKNQRIVELPAVLPLPPYQFVVFQPADEPDKIKERPTNLEGSRLRSRKVLRFVPAVIFAAVVIGFAALIIFDQSRRTAAVPAKPQATAAPGTLPSAALTPEPKETPKPIPEIASATTPAPPEPKAEPKPEPPLTKFDLEALAQRVAPSVFRLEVKDEVGNLAGTGTAFAISADGLAVTNFHVVEHGSSFTARTTQGSEFSVSGVTATDPAADLALISLKGTGIQSLDLGDSDALKIGAPLAIFGCPQGLTGTLSEGIVSARRTDPVIMEFTMPNGGNVIQTTAPFSPGSSGSPVFDASGKVVGVATIASISASAQSINFIVPVESVKKLRKDSLDGLAKSFSTPPRPLPADTQKQAIPVDTPEAQLLADREFKKLDYFFRQADWIEMQKVAKGLAVKYPESPSAHMFLATALSGLKLHEAAEIEAKRGLALDVDNSLLWFTLGSAQLDQFRHVEARISLKKSAAISPDFATTWQRLAASYLVSGEYIEAVSPMDQLRRLDRPEFERLLGILRSIKFQPPELQALLDHFDGMAEQATRTNEVQATPEKLATSLISSFLRHGEGQDVRVELADYAPTVDPYFDQGRQSTAYILKDITTYRTQWPRRSL